jgi:hypothetical protein
MSPRLLVPAAIVVAACTIAPVPSAGATGALLGMRPDPGAHGSIALLHPPAVRPARAHGRLVASLAAAHRASAPAPLPAITAVHPLKPTIGGKLTIVGRHFVRGRRRDTVVFLRAGAPAVFLKADSATATRITVTLTRKLERFMLGPDNGQKAPTLFHLRVLARRFGLAFTPRKLSPTVQPRKQKSAPTGDNSPPAPTCSLAIARANPGVDADGDGLTNGLELQIGTDPCNADTDGDGISDGYEYQSALDLNSRALPYPGKRPYPNALDPSDANTDYDGDGLTMADEYAAWVTYGGKRFPLNYSDGTQTTGGPVIVTPQTQWEDMNGDGILTDDEKDLDGDGLTNWDEAHGRMTPAWWLAAYTQETAYPLHYQQTDWLDPDTDGDGVLDGADDVDHDGFTNASEVARGPYWVQPFNPCLPDWKSPTCDLHPPFDDPYPPFGSGFDPNEPTPLQWPRP